jgi:hypothetical protein
VLEICREVPEATVVRFSNEGDAANERFGRFGGVGDAGDEAETVDVLKAMRG